MTLLIKGQKQIRNGYYTRERIGHSPTWVSGAARYRDNPSSISSITLSSQPLLLRGSRDFESQPIMRGFFERSSPLGIAAKLQENLDRLGGAAHPPRGFPCASGGDQSFLDDPGRP